MNKKPKLLVVSGPNGAGKSTFVLENRIIDTRYIINPDTIAEKLNPNCKNDTSTVVKAGKIALQKRQEFLANKQSFGIETTLSGHSVIEMIKTAKEKGYYIYFVYIGLKNSQASKNRVATRVSKGGHSVPSDAIPRRYIQSLSNMSKVAPIVDMLYIFDNSGKEHRLLLGMKDRRIKYQSENIPKWAKSIIPEIIKLRSDLISET